MHAKSSYQRLLGIDRAIRAGRPTARELADLLGVTPRTVRRDIRVMRERFGAPIVHEKGSGYCYLDPGYPGPALPAPEVRSLVALVSRQVLNQFQGTSHNHKLGSLVRRLGQSLREQLKATFSSHGLLPTDPVLLESLEEAIGEGLTVGLRYYHASADALLRIAVKPLRVEGEFLVAGTYHGCAPARYRIGRIHGLVKRASQADELEHDSTESFPVSVRFDGRHSGWLSEQRIFPVLDLIAVEEEGLRCRLEVESTTAFVPWLMSFGTQARLLGPPGLVACLNEELSRLVEFYRP